MSSTSTSIDPLSTDFLLDWSSTSVFRSILLSSLTLIVSCLVIVLSYWILFYFDSDKNNFSTSSNPTSSHQTTLSLIQHVRSYKNQVSQQKKPKLLPLFLSSIISPWFIFGLVAISIFTSWIASSIFVAKVFHHHDQKNSTDQNTLIKSSPFISLLPFVFSWMTYIIFFGINLIAYFVPLRQNLANGIILHFVQIFVIGTYVMMNWFSQPFSLAMKQKNNNPTLSSMLSIHPHPVCANLQFVSLLSSFFVLTIFILLFIRFEMRSSLENDGDDSVLVESLEKILPPEIFPRVEGKKKQKTESKRSMLEVMKSRKRI